MFASLLGSRFWIVGYISLACGLWLPGEYGYLEPLIPVVLGTMLFFTSLRVRLSALAGEITSLRALRRIGALAGLKLVVLPLVVYALGLLLAPEWALGLFLVAAMPAGMSSAALTGLYGGNIGMALMLILATSLLCPLTVPLQLQLLGGNPDWPLAARKAGYLLLLLAIPFALAQIAWRAAPRFVAERDALWQRCTLGVMSALIFVSAAPCRDAWSHVAGHALLVPIALTGVASALFVATGLVSRIALATPEAIAFGCACIYMNNGLGVAFAAKFYPDDAHMLLPAIMMQVPMLGATVLFGTWMGRRKRVMAA